VYNYEWLVCCTHVCMAYTVHICWSEHVGEKAVVCCACIMLQGVFSRFLLMPVCSLAVALRQWALLFDVSSVAYGCFWQVACSSLPPLPLPLPPPLPSAAAAAACCCCCLLLFVAAVLPTGLVPHPPISPFAKTSVKGFNHPSGTRSAQLS